MAKTQYSIKMDYANAKREVTELKSLASRIDGQKGKLLDCRNSLSGDWKSDSALKYMNKMQDKVNELDRLARFLREIAETAGTVAKNTYDADMRALALAKQRNDGSHFSGGGTSGW